MEYNFSKNESVEMTHGFKHNQSKATKLIES
jgi:hypothetical protein